MTFPQECREAYLITGTVFHRPSFALSIIGVLKQDHLEIKVVEEIHEP